MTYPRKMAHEAQDRWLNGPGGHAYALEAVEITIGEVIERAAREVEDSGGDNAAYHAARIRSLMTEEG